MFTETYYLLGGDISGSYSPEIYNYLFRCQSFNMNYSAFSLHRKRFQDFFRQLMEIKEVAGINITFPFKKEAMQNCPHRKSARAYAIGGINIVYCGDSGEAFCDNTDGEGFCRFLSRHDIEPESILLLGTGITSRSILYSLRENNIKCLSVCTRDKSGIYDSDFFSSRDICIREYGDIHPGDYELIINTTPVGFDSLGLKTEDYCGRLFEVKYSEPTCAEYNGIELLIEQALVNFRLFTGYDVDNRYWELKKYLSGVN